MKRTIILASTVAAIAASAAGAADIYGGYRGTPASPAAYIAQYNWTGAYVGANIGYQFGSTTLFNLEPSGAAGGIQGGYNWQFGQFVVGGEADIQISAAEDTFAAYKFSNPWFGTVRARAGYAMNNVLLYATGGLAYGKSEFEYFGINEEHTRAGWAVGAGIEVGLAPQLSARAEYLFVDLSSTNYVFTNMNSGIESSIVRFGLNYRF